MKAPPFDYACPRSLSEAIGLLAAANGEARIIAGGQSLLPLLAFRLASPSLLVDPPADVFSTNIFWNRAIEAGRLYGAVHQGLWFDVGTPQAIPVVESMIAHG